MMPPAAKSAYSAAPKTILFVGGALETVPGVVRAREMGLRVAVSDRDPMAPCMKLADFVLTADTYDPDATLAAVHALDAETQICGVLCLATDVPVTVATVATALALPGISLKSARLAADKILMKERFVQDGVPTPPFEEVRSADDIRTAAEKWGWPLVIKPTDSRGARGVMRLTADNNLSRAFERALSFSPSGRVLAEKFLNGPQASTESLVINDVCHTPGFSDRNYEFLDRFSPYIIENGGDLPSCLDHDMQDRIKKTVGLAATAMGIANGVVKGDIVIHEGAPYVIELAARLSGGCFCTHEIPLNTGVDFIGLAIRQAIGEHIEPKELEPRFQRHVCQRYLFPEPGRVKDISGVDEVKRRDHVALCDVRVKRGDIIGPVDSHPARGGMVITTGQDRKEAALNAEQAVRDIKIITVS